MLFVRLLLARAMEEKKSDDFPAFLAPSKKIILEKEAFFIDKKFRERVEINDESVQIRGCAFTNMTTFSNGGAIFLATQTAKISDSIFFYCSSAQYGGAIYSAQSDSIEVKTTCFFRCFAINKGNAFAIFSSNTANISLVIELECKLDENTISLNYGTNAFVRSSAQLSNINCSKCSSVHEASFLSAEKATGLIAASFCHIDRNSGWASCTLLNNRYKLEMSDINIINSTYTDSLFFVSFDGNVSSGTFIQNTFNEIVSLQLSVNINFYIINCYCDDWRYIPEFVKLENAKSGSPEAPLQPFPKFKLKNCKFPAPSKRSWKRIILSVVLTYLAIILLYIFYKNFTIIQLMAAGGARERRQPASLRKRRRVLTV